MSRAGSNDRQREFAKLFMSFSGKHNRHNVWQDFVWMTACALVAKQGYISVHDPACGAGATLVSAANTLRGMGINYQQCALFIGQDIDYTVGLMCYVQLSLLGCAGYVRIGNTITDPLTGRVLFGNAKDENIWYTPMFFTDRWATLRAIDEAKRLFSAVATGFPQAEQDNPSVNMGAEEEATETVLEPIPEPAPEEPAVPVITVKKTGRKKQLEGQLMFDF